MTSEIVIPSPVRVIFEIEIDKNNIDFSRGSE
jgi:hypothetical protein